MAEEYYFVRMRCRIRTIAASARLRQSRANENYVNLYKSIDKIYCKSRVRQFGRFGVHGFYCSKDLNFVDRIAMILLSYR